ncbi:MAG: hypothetical protein AB1345_10050, partial [Chloroflexota bacterium]
MMMNPRDDIILWLLEGDPAVRWQTLQDLLEEDTPRVVRERERIATEGWGARFLALQDAAGTWGNGLYSPKWISTTYTMLTLWRLGLPWHNPQAQKGCHLLLERGFYKDGGINFSSTIKYSETCITGMVLALLSYFRYPDDRVHHLAEHLLGQQMHDGGWNCQSYRGATHSSFHTTISVLEGLFEYEKAFPEHAALVQEAQARGREFLLVHQLYLSHRTGEVVDGRLTRFPFPPRWYYDVLRALDYFQACNAGGDERLKNPIELLKKRQKPEGYWILNSGPRGRIFFEMEKAREPSRWNTLRALRVLRWWKNGKSC